MWVNRIINDKQVTFDQLKSPKGRLFDIVVLVKSKQKRQRVNIAQKQKIPVQMSPNNIKSIMTCEQWQK